MKDLLNNESQVSNSPNQSLNKIHKNSSHHSLARKPTGFYEKDSSPTEKHRQNSPISNKSEIGKSEELKKFSREFKTFISKKKKSREKLNYFLKKFLDIIKFFIILKGKK